MHLPPKPHFPLHPDMITLDKATFPPPASVRSLPSTAVFLVRYWKSQTRCSGLDCQNNLQTVGKNFQRCARCNIIGYCGRECQKQDWINPEYPHKKVCPILCDIVAKGGGLSLFLNYETPKIHGYWNARGGVKEEDLQYLDDWRKDREKRRVQLPDGTEWTPGFDDYDSLLTLFQGAKAQYPDRLQRWPSEVAKVKALLEIMPFWDQDIDV
ncbi:hypothetical protein H0H93_007333 [Arthromyces matolae]|nr:hypothetical protein H0H93_007333 [Arthromyces matolae]